MSGKPKYWWEPDTSTDFEPNTSTDVVSTGSTSIDDAKLEGLNLQNDLLKKQLAGPETYGGLSIGDWSTGLGLGLKAYDMFDPAKKELASKQMAGLDANIKLANQQVKSNKQAMADRKQFNSTWANASNGLGKVNA